MAQGTLMYKDKYIETKLRVFFLPQYNISEALERYKDFGWYEAISQDMLTPYQMVLILRHVSPSKASEAALDLTEMVASLNSSRVYLRLIQRAREGKLSQSDAQGLYNHGRTEPSPSDRALEQAIALASGNEIKRHASTSAWSSPESAVPLAIDAAFEILKKKRFSLVKIEKVFAEALRSKYPPVSEDDFMNAFLRKIATPSF